MTATGITRRQRKAINAILAYPTLSQASQASGIPYRTLWRWVHENQAFKDALQEAESQVLNDAMRRLLGMQGKAIDTLESILTNPASRQSDRLKAVELALSHVLKLRTATTIEEKLKALQSVIVELESNRGTKEISNLD